MKYRPSVFVVTYARNKGKIYYLLLKRKLHWKGWEFPKGGLKGIMERVYPRRAVKREIIEETGLNPIKIKKYYYSGIFRYNKLFEDRPGFIGQSFRLFSAEVKKQKPNLNKNKDMEHIDYLWADYKGAMKKLTWPNQRKCLKIVNDWLEHSYKKVYK